MVVSCQSYSLGHLGHKFWLFLVYIEEIAFALSDFEGKKREVDETTKMDTHI